MASELIGWHRGQGWREVTPAGRKHMVLLWEGGGQIQPGSRAAVHPREPAGATDATKGRAGFSQPRDQDLPWMNSEWDKEH